MEKSLAVLCDQHYPDSVGGSSRPFRYSNPIMPAPSMRCLRFMVHDEVVCKVMVVIDLDIQGALLKY